MINKKFFIRKLYCKKEDLPLVENYEQALNDPINMWDCHHRLETHWSNGEPRTVEISQKELKALDMYYNRPPEELIFLPKSEHLRLHCTFKVGKKIKGHSISDETKEKISQSLKEYFECNPSLNIGRKKTLKMKQEESDRCKNAISYKVASEIKNNPVTVISGYWLGLYNHKGYKDYIDSAISLGRKLVIIIPNNNQIMSKYGMLYTTSNRIRAAFQKVYKKRYHYDFYIITSKDEDATQCHTLGMINEISKDVIFYKDGGEYNLDNLPEAKVPGIKVVFGSNPKVASSSEILGIKKISSSGEEKR